MLDTLFKRNDGYHEIEMIMTTVDLNDRLTFHKRKKIEKIVVEIEHNYVPSNHKNLHIVQRNYLLSNIN